MRILAVSDYVEPILHQDFDAANFAGVDLIVSCGDLPPEYLSFLFNVFNVPLYYVRGNHDIRYAARPPEGCVDIHGRIERFKGLNFMGLEGSMWYNGGPNQYTERQMRRMIWGLRFKIWRRKGIDILLTHAPPRHIHDAEDLCHRGFVSYRDLIARYAPRFFLHGHIHASFTDPTERMTRVGRTRVINCCGYYLFDTDET